MLPGADMAFVYVDGGSNPIHFNSPPSSLFEPVAILCTGTKTIGAHLQQIPNEAITFSGDPTYSRSEDAMIAYTWSHFINDTFEYDWLARMPMTKASIKALDAMQEFVATLEGVPPLQRFVVGGASKRGWTTWMVGAMDDPRVVGIVPIVAPIANLIPQINEMWKSCSFLPSSSSPPSPLPSSFSFSLYPTFPLPFSSFTPSLLLFLPLVYIIIINQLKRSIDCDDDDDQMEIGHLHYKITRT